MRRQGWLTVVAVAFASATTGAAQAAIWVAPEPLAVYSNQDAALTSTASVYAGVTKESRPFLQVRPAGAPVQEPGLLPEDAQNAPALAAAPDGRIVAAWTQGATLMTAVLEPGTKAFGAPVATPGTTDAFVREVAVDGTGVAWVLWLDSVADTGAHRLHIGRVAPGGGQVTDDVIVDDGAPGGTLTNGVLAADGQGGVVAAWRRTAPGGATELRAALRPAGGTFTTTTLDTGGFPRPLLAMNQAGAAALVWQAGDSSIRVRLGGAGGFAPAIGPPVSGAAPSSPAVGIDSAGRVRVAWLALVDGRRRPQTATAVDGAFGPAQWLGDEQTDALPLELAVAADGTALLAWPEKGAAAPGAFVATHAAGGEAFGPAETAGPARPEGIDVRLRVLPGGDGLMMRRFRDGTAVLSEVVGLDASAPVLTAVEVPPGAVAGKPATFSATATDLWGPVSLSWSFGDGGSAAGGLASHTFLEAATRTVTVTATDAAGHATIATREVTVAPAPPAENTGGSGVVPDLTAPGVRRLRFKGRSFRFALTEAAKVRIVARRGKRRVRVVRALGAAGPNRVRLAGKRLRPGRYRARLTAVDAAGNRSRTVAVRFRVGGET